MADLNKKYLIPALLLAFLALFLFYTCSSGAENKKKILLIHSYHPEYPWVAEITEGVKNALKDENVELRIFYMDTKRRTSDEWKVNAGQNARREIDVWEPDAVITADDNAQIFVAQYYCGRSPFFVFCGLNGDPAEYCMPCTNITGIIERPHYEESLKYASTFVKNIRKIAVLSDTCTTSRGALDYMSRIDLGQKVLGYHLIDDFEVWKERSEEYNMDADAICVYMYHTLKELPSNDESMYPPAVMKWSVENLDIPIIGFFDFAIEDGALCGVVESGQEHGYKSAKIALALVKGESIDKYPVSRAVEGIKMLNLKTAKRLGINITQEMKRSADKIIE